MPRMVFALLLLLSTSPALAQQKGTLKEPAEDQPVLPDKLDRLTLTLDSGGHTAKIKKVFFTPDSKQLITLGMDHAIHFWDVETGERVKVLHPPGVGGISAAALSDDGKRLVLASTVSEGDKQTRVVYLLALPEGKVERVLRGAEEPIGSVAISLDGKRVAAGAGVGSIIRIWDLDSDKDAPAQVLRKAPSYGLAFSQDGSRLACVGTPAAGKEKGKIFDLAADKQVAAFQGSHVVWSRDGKTLATGANKFGLHLWDADGKLRGQHLQGKSIQWIAFSKDSQKILCGWIAPGGGLHATLIDVTTGEALKEFQPSSKLQPRGIRFSAAKDGALSPDGQYAATGGGTGALGEDVAPEAYLWNMRSGDIHQRLAGRGSIGGLTTAAWSADGKAISWHSGVKGRPKSPSFHLGELRLGPPIPAAEERKAVRQGSRFSLERDPPGGVKVLKDGKQIARLNLGDIVTDETLVGEDQAVVTGRNKGNLWLFDASTGEVLRRFAQTWAFSIAPSPKGRFLLTSSFQDQTLRVYSLDRDKPLLSLFIVGQDWVAWTPEGYYAATPGGERLIGWIVDNGMDQMPTYHPAERFRKQLHRPDVIKLLLEKGNLKDALESANAILKKEGKIVPEGVVNPNNLLPPKTSLRILDRSALPQVKVKASAVAAIVNQPVTALRLLVNGRPLPDGAGLKNFETGVKQAEVEWTIDLPPGRHHLAVLARSPDVSSISESVEVEFLVRAQQPLLHVLAIGINDYEDKTLKLDFAAKDAQDIAAAFKNGKGGLFRDVLDRPLVNAQARRDIILEALADLRKKADPNDLAVVFFAGHGVKEKDKFYLLTVEAKTSDLARTALSGEDLRKSLGEFPCQVLLMLDACHSSGGIKNFRPAVDDITRTLTDDECGVAVLCAAMAHEKALEKSGNGLFTRAVVQALGRAEGVPFNRHNRLLYVHHLHTYVFDEVSQQSGDRQHPFLSLPWVVESFPVAQFAAQTAGKQ